MSTDSAHEMRTAKKSTRKNRKESCTLSERLKRGPKGIIKMTNTSSGIVSKRALVCGYIAPACVLVNVHTEETRTVKLKAEYRRLK